MMREKTMSVLYVYRCAECRHDGEIHLPGDSHDGVTSECAVCGAPVILEWDGGVTFETPRTRAKSGAGATRHRPRA